MNLSKECVNLLNEVLVVDNASTRKLVETRVKMPKQIINHPFLVLTDEGELGLLGVLNGLLSKLGLENICMEFDENDNLKNFSVLKRNK
jgi:hypothetical protein